MENTELQNRIKLRAEVYYQDVLQHIKKTEHAWLKDQTSDFAASYYRMSYQYAVVQQLKSNDHRLLEVEAATLGYELVPVDKSGVRSPKQIKIPILARLKRLHSLTAVIAQAEASGHGDAVREDLAHTANALVSDLQVLVGDLM